MSVQNSQNQNGLTHVRLSPGTNHQKFRGQQEVRGQATNPMNSCFSDTALFFDSSPNPSHHFLSLALFLSFTPLSLCHPVSQPFHWANTAGPIFICLSPPLHLLEALMLPPFPFLPCHFLSYLQLFSFCLTFSLSLYLVSFLSIKNSSSLPVQLLEV